MFQLEKGLPEQVGIRSDFLAQILKECLERNIQLHSLMVIRHGKMVLETAKFPTAKEDKHLVYSCSKSFTATAVGIAVDEGLLKLDDRLIDYFPEVSKVGLDERILKATIRNLLMMSTGHGRDSVGDMCNSSDPWPEVFFRSEVVYEPGTTFVYDSGGTYMLSEVISRVTGRSLFEYMKEKFFGPLDITDVSWDVHGSVNTGAWGVLIAPRDLCKLGLLYLNKGMWKGKRILSEEYINEATAPLISTRGENTLEERIGGWSRNYGFSFWQNNETSFRADGSFGQMCMIFPKEDMVIVTTAEEGNTGRIMSLIEKYILAPLSEMPGGLNSRTAKTLHEAVAAFEAAPTYAPGYSWFLSMLDGKTYQLEGDHEGEITFHVEGTDLKIEIDGIQSITAGETRDCIGTTKCVLPLPTCSPLLGKEQREREWKSVAHYYWAASQTLMVSVAYPETGHRQDWTMVFTGKKLLFTIADSNKDLLMPVGCVSDRNMRFADSNYIGIEKND